MKKRFWRCFLCEKNIYDDDCQGPLIYHDKSEEFHVCVSCAVDMGSAVLNQKRYLLVECSRCGRFFLPLPDFDPSEYHSKVMSCPFCKEKTTVVFNEKPEGSVIRELSPEEFKKHLKKWSPLRRCDP
ncbi:MAG: hypothetical protein RDV48_02780 [Candidatus Eremiobacteraeota bacterium]|nr:hypothetical protein [Candidatus Eremiobacteraeota bacterium]